MLEFAHAKINIGLHITRKRSDGYHELETVFYPIRLYDAVEVLPAQKHFFEVVGSTLPVDSSNLCVKAYQLLAEHEGLPSAEIRLLKRIPVGAGLGGGSSDAAATLRLLNEVFDLKLPAQKLANYAARLGADCPFFLYDQPMYAEGIGTELTPLAVDLDAYHIVVVKPDVFISTAEAYADVQPKPSDLDLRKAIAMPIQQWKYIIKNDFENSIFSRHPQLSELKNRFYEMGAHYASMSGSGSAVYGIFDSLEKDWTSLEPYGELFLPQW
ncbi:MAG TPA: 4-(cytidine 5'-diphospho)-2-C-methyl-D-erythritol kinase [Candidatus Sphingobacterium stercorigallinarum]|nr:4-(cytidine 5'-diphospho)-2-C-methyl-D-erythritol kinase [Candidatus Sphingobacterium stercorigallinarum]